MNINKFSLFLVLSLFISASALGGEVKCQSLKALDKISGECNDNINYVNAGKECLKNLEAFIFSQTKLSVNKVRELSAKTELDSKVVRKVIRESKSVFDVIKAYRLNIFYPEDWDAPEELIGDGEAFLNSQRCYSQANNSLKSNEETVTLYIKKFSDLKK